MNYVIAALINAALGLPCALLCAVLFGDNIWAGLTGAIAGNLILSHILMRHFE